MSNNSDADSKLSLSERRRIEHEKALAVIKKAEKSLFNWQVRDSTEHENIKEETATNAMDITAQEPSKSHASAINISDLVKDETIKLVLDESSRCVEEPKPSTSSRLTEEKISFEPNDFTARSTLYSSNSKYRKAAQSMSVSDILATSCAPKVREIGERLRRSSAASSTVSSYNRQFSLPRTEDMSSCAEAVNTKKIEDSWDGAANFSFAANNSVKSAVNGEDFAPAELMHSQLINDEIAWAQERANMPNIALSEEAKKKVGLSNLKDASATFSASSAFDDPNFSVGRFFNMRSENLSDIVGELIPRSKERQPVALVDESLNGTKYKHGNSKDSGNATTDSSYLLSISAVDRALSEQ